MYTVTRRNIATGLEETQGAFKTQEEAITGADTQRRIWVISGMPSVYHFSVYHESRKIYDTQEGK